MDPRGLVDLRGVAGEFVPEAVQINALASRDEPLGIRDAGPEMNRRTVISRDLLCAEVARKRLDLRGRWPPCARRSIKWGSS